MGENIGCTCCMQPGHLQKKKKKFNLHWQRGNRSYNTLKFFMSDWKNIHPEIFSWIMFEEY